MLFENPLQAAKLPFPFPPPMQATAAVPNLSNPIDNSGLMEQHSRDLHNALVATMQSNNAAAAAAVVLNGSLTAAVNPATANPVTNSNPQQPQSQPPTQLQQQQQQQQPSNQQQILPQTSPQGVDNKLVLSNGNGSSSSGRSTPNNTTDPAPGKLFVGGLSWQTSSEKLKEYFNLFGTVTDVLIMKDPVTQRSRGFGFITFQEPESVDKVLKIPIHTLDGKKIDPKHATPKNRPKQANKTKKIFVGGVSQDTSADEVKAYFNQFGLVEETVMLMDQQTKRHRGFGFVTFENEDVVDRVCEIHFHTIKNKKVECKKAQPKEAVTAPAQLLQKRLMLGALGVRLPTAPGQLIGAAPGATVVPSGVNQLLMQPQQVQALQAAAAAQSAMLNQFQVQNHHAAAAAAAAHQGYGKLITTYPQAIRYTPYNIPASHTAAAVATSQHQQPPQGNPQTAQTITTAAGSQQPLQLSNGVTLANPQNAGVATNPYPGYALANVDMSSFQNVDWGALGYGMGMYV